MADSRTRAETDFKDNTVEETATVRPGGVTDDVTTERATRTGYEVPVVREERREAPSVSVRPSLRDRSRWGPVWAGLLTTLATFVFVSLITYAAGAWNFQPGGGSDADWINAAILVGSFLLGGFVAAATAIYRAVSDGVLQGLFVWALGVATFVVLALFGGGVVLGAIGDAIGQLNLVQQNPNLPAAQAQALTESARDAAFWASVVIGCSLAAAMIGGALGSKVWPAKKDVDDHRVAGTTAEPRTEHGSTAAA